VCVSELTVKPVNLHSCYLVSELFEIEGRWFVTRDGRKFVAVNAAE
jgi:hypothetical protein